MSAYLEDTVAIPLTRPRFGNLLDARTTLVDAGSFEERYELVLENYKAFELFFVNQSLESRLGGDYRIEPASRLLSEANRLLINLLTSLCSYTEQVSSEFKSAPSGPVFKTAITRKLADLRKTSFNFGLIEVVRNYAQHVQMPVEGITARHSRTTTWPESVFPYCTGASLHAYAGRNRRRQVGLQHSLAEKVDLRELAYSAVRTLSELHCSARSLVQADCVAARDEVAEALREVNDAIAEAGTVKKKGRPAKIVELAGGENGSTESEVSHTLMLEWDDVRIARAAKNRRPIADFKKPSGHNP